MLPMLPPQLNLTDAQRDQIKAIADTHKDEWKALADRGRTAHMALDEAINADTVNDAAIRQKSADASAVDADIAVARAHAHAEVFQILTADQKAQLKEHGGDEEADGDGRSARTTLRRSVPGRFGLLASTSTSSRRRRCASPRCRSARAARRACRCAESRAPRGGAR